MSRSKTILKHLIPFLGLVLCFGVVLYFLLPTNHQKLGKSLGTQISSKKSFSYVAIGDSLTEGIGDTSNQGGFVPILSKALGSQYNLQVISANYGVAGNTSNQILKRMQEQSDIQKSLKNADLMTLTVGGNDVIHVIKDNITDLKLSTFTKPAKAYQTRLRKIIETARQHNTTLPIYIIGIYNPFYLNFPEMTEMQDVVDNWNDATEEVTKEYSNVYFVPVNDLLYKGINGEEGITSASESDTTSASNSTVINDALFEEDHFHPNNTGYQIMSDAILAKISKTKKEWQSE